MSVFFSFCMSVFFLFDIIFLTFFLQSSSLLSFFSFFLFFLFFLFFFFSFFLFFFFSLFLFFFFSVFLFFSFSLFLFCLSVSLFFVHLFSIDGKLNFSQLFY